ncbi:MAG: CcdB family protein [Gammaproteobacteria bacterium]|nr:CcdB family protein [Gammaproteobacteria bacterium]
MPQLDVYPNTNPASREAFPFLVDVQANMFDELRTRVVIPLSKAGALPQYPMAYLTPVVSFAGEAYVLMTPQLAGVARVELEAPAGNLAAQERVIATAIEFLVRGY